MLDGKMHWIEDLRLPDEIHWEEIEKALAEKESYRCIGVLLSRWMDEQEASAHIVDNSQYWHDNGHRISGEQKYDEPCRADEDMNQTQY